MFKIINKQEENNLSKITSQTGRLFSVTSLSTCFFTCLLLIVSACQSDTKTPKKTTSVPQKKVVKKQNKPATPSPYWTAARKEIPLNKVQESKVKEIQNKYKTEINQLKKQKKWNAKERTRIEGERAAEIKKLLGKDLAAQYEQFNTNWSKKRSAPKAPAASPYWLQAKKDIPLKDKEINDIKTIQNKYKAEINQLKKQKKWNAKERTRIEGERAEEIEKLLGKKYDKYEKFNTDWRKKKK